MSEKQKIKVLVVEDSQTIQNYLIEVISSDPRFEVIGNASNGQSAIELCEKLRPDIITLDMMIPIISGLGVTEYIMAFCPTPIIVISAYASSDNLHRTYDTLAAGAIDVIPKPSGEKLDEEWEKNLLNTLHIASRIKVITHPRAKLKRSKMSSFEKSIIHPIKQEILKPIRCIAIGASTGGPAAVVEILKGLPANFPIPILLIIHIGEQFSISLAKWLDSESPLRVTCAKDRDPLPPIGKPGVIMAAAEYHMIVRDEKIIFTSDPERHSCRPSIDVLFESIASDLGSAAIGCLLTGMGRDGAQGLLAMKQSGSFTIAQDEATSVVYGMPKEAYELNAARSVLPLSEISSTLLEIIEEQKA